MSQIRAAIDPLTEQLTAQGYSGRQDRIRALIPQCRTTLRRGTRQLGPWETLEIDTAERAVDANLLRLALTAAQKALAVSKRPIEEYDYGMARARAPHNRCAVWLRRAQLTGRSTRALSLSAPQGAAAFYTFVSSLVANSGAEGRFLRPPIRRLR